MTNAFVTYVKESKDELSKVAWPNRQMVMRDTLVVLGISVGVAIFIGALDFAFSTGLAELITRFR